MQMHLGDTYDNRILPDITLCSSVCSSRLSSLSPYLRITMLPANTSFPKESSRCFLHDLEYPSRCSKVQIV